MIPALLVASALDVPVFERRDRLALTGVVAGTNGTALGEMRRLFGDENRR
jgi:hypothetical protein